MQVEPKIVSQEDLKQASEATLAGLWNNLNEILRGDVGAVVQSLGESIVPAALGLGALFIAYFVAKLLARICSAPIQQRVDETLGRFFGKLVFYTVMIATGVGIITRLGYSVTSLSAILAAAGFAIGLAFQGTLSNFAAGVLLLVFRPFKVGDTVVVAGTHGKVFEIDLFSTSIDTSDNRRIILPNSSIAGNTIENMTHHEHRRIEVTVGIAYDCDLMLSRSALTEAAQSLGDLIVAGENRGCKITTKSLGLHSVDWGVEAWVHTSDMGLAREILTVAIKESLDAAGLRIPFPQLDVHWHGNVQSGVPSLSPLTIHDEAPSATTFVPRQRAA